jgi:hypothetical protein
LYDCLVYTAKTVRWQGSSASDLDYVIQNLLLSRWGRNRKVRLLLDLPDLGNDACTLIEQRHGCCSMQFDAAATPGSIHNEADLVIAADEFVCPIQPGASEHTRYEQGVMVSMVDADGNLIPQQRGRRSIQPGPVVIRKGLDIDRILLLLSDLFPSWDYRHGTYY